LVTKSKLSIEVNLSYLKTRGGGDEGVEFDITGIGDVIVGFAIIDCGTEFFYI
jgi:hypothetical protein